MGSPERTIMNQIKTTLATITTGGGYNYDLSGDDQVQIGGKFIPDRIPAAYIFAGGNKFCTQRRKNGPEFLFTDPACND